MNDTSLRAEHELHRRRRGRNLGVLAILLGLIALLFAVSVVKLSASGQAGNPSAAQGGDWGTAFKEWIQE